MTAIRSRLGAIRGSELAGLAGDSFYAAIWLGAISVADLVQIALITHALGLREYGRFALVLAFVLLVGQIFDVRLGPAMTTFGARKLAAGDSRGAVGTFQLSYVVDGATGLLGFAVVAVLAPLVGPRLVGEDGTQLILLFAVTLLVSTVDETSISILRLLNRFRLLAIYSTALEVARLALVGVMLATWRSLGGLLIALIVYDLAGAIANALFAGFALRKETGRSLRRSALAQTRDDRRPMLRMVFHTSLASYSRLAQVQLPVILLGVWTAPTQVGIYKVAASAASGIARIVDPMFTAILPRLARLRANDHFADMRALVFKGTAIASFAMGAVFIAFIVFRQPILGALGGKSAEAGGIVLVLAGAAQVVNGIVFWNYPLLYACERANVVARVSVAGALVQVVALALLVPPFGATGAATALLVSQMMINIVATALALRALKRPAREDRPKAADALIADVAPLSTGRPEAGNA